MSDEKVHLNSTAKKDQLTISVIGAGIIGVLCALKLQREGHQVTLIDKEAPGNGCSFGNAGILARSSFVPLSSPSTLMQAPSWLLKPDGPLCVNWSYLPKIIPWLFNYIKAGFRADLVKRGEDIHQLTDQSVQMYKALAAQLGCDDLIVETDYLQVYRSRAGFEKGEGDMNARRRLGFAINNLDAAQLQALEPNLSKEYMFAHHLTDHAFVNDPHALVLAIYESFLQQGGTFVQEAVNDINLGEKCEVVTAGQTISSDKLVVAAGAFSGRILKSTGVNIPIETERGYHITCPDPQVQVNRPVMDGDLKFFVSPMSMGHRFAGLVELAGLDHPLQERRVKVLERSAKLMLPGVNTENATSWMGFRPTFSDSVPVIGAAPNDERVIYAFGHQHLGLTCAPMTANIVSDLIAQRPSQIDISCYDIKRLL
ncbi:MAG: FAD-dependent oxidoreductase [Oceanospirillaceae bacterium]